MIFGDLFAETTRAICHLCISETSLREDDVRGGHLLTSGNRMKKQDPGAVEEKSDVK